jgi:hypothetical protein
MARLPTECQWTQGDRPLAGRPFIEPTDLTGEDLLTVPVDIERLDIYTLPGSRRNVARGGA